MIPSFHKVLLTIVPIIGGPQSRAERHHVQRYDDKQRSLAQSPAQRTAPTVGCTGQKLGRDMGPMYDGAQYRDAQVGVFITMMRLATRRGGSRAELSTRRPGTGPTAWRWSPRGASR